MSQRHGARNDLARDRRGNAEPVEPAAADTRRRNHALRLRQGDPRLRRRCAGGDQILFRGDSLREQPLFAREVRISELKPRPRRLDLALDLRRLAAFDDRNGLAASDRLAEVTGERDHASRNCGRDDLRSLWVALDDRGQLDRPGPADDRPSDLDARCGDLVGTQCDDAFTGMTAFSTALFRARCRLIGSCAFGSCLVSAILAAAGSQEQGERRRAREIKALHH